MWYRVAVSLRPDNPAARSQLAAMLAQQRGQGLRKLEEALSHAQAAVAIAPDYLAGHYTLGNVRRDLGDREGAIACYRELARLDPKSATPYHGLAGVASDDDEAIGHFREAIRRDPRAYVSRNMLGYLLFQQKGQFDEAVEQFREALKIETRFVTPKFHIQRVELWQELTRQLPDIEAGRAKPTSLMDAPDLAVLCSRPFQRRYRLAVRLLEEVGRAEPHRLVPSAAGTPDEQPGFFGARSAVLAAAGKAIDLPDFGVEEWGYLMDRAHRWLQADLAIWAGRAKDEQQQYTVRLHLGAWKEDPGLAHVRNPESLAAMAPTDRRRWEAFWADVDKALTVTGKGPSPNSGKP
jgi:tetratricopeptide (TPR) repeat protein